MNISREVNYLTAGLKYICGIEHIWISTGPALTG
jgi:hypothetical protein